MTAEDFVDNARRATSPEGRLALIRHGIISGLITYQDAQKILDAKPRPPHLRLVPTPKEP